MTLVIELSEEALERLAAAARAHGVTVEQLAAETLTKASDHADLDTIVSATIAEHRRILDTLATT